MRKHPEFDYTVWVVPAWVLALSRPLFRPSLPHRGRILRLAPRRLGPVVRDVYGRY